MRINLIIASILVFVLINDSVSFPQRMLRNLFQPRIYQTQQATKKQKICVDESCTDDLSLTYDTNINQDNITENAIEHPVVENTDLQTEFSTNQSITKPVDIIELEKPVENIESTNVTEQHLVEIDKSGEILEFEKPIITDDLGLTEDEKKVVELVNQARARSGLPALQISKRLMETARKQASHMARTGIFRHGNWGVAENIAMGQRSPSAVMNAWLRSSGHRRNIMNRSHRTIGIGVYKGKNGQLYWCQQFSSK
jgi:uncharacterized protein YkwD